MSPDTPPHCPAPVDATPCQAGPTPSPTAADLLRRVVTASDLDRQAPAPAPWLWHGYLGPGKVTLLTSQWKSGKTTRVSLLWARMAHAGQRAGLPGARGSAFVISEESAADWWPRLQHLDVRDHVHLLCRPFPAQPGRDRWLALIETAEALHQRQGTQLVVIDSLAQFLPAHAENSSGALLECLTPLQRLATAGLGVLLVHPPHKGPTLAGQAARGSGTLPSFVDILVEMGFYAGPDDLDRRRRLVAFSRYGQTPRHLLVELQAEGLDYTVLQSGPDAALGESWQGVLDILTSAWTKLTRQEILDEWPDDDDRPDATTLWRWLSRAVAQGTLRRRGAGRPHDPFRYWLPARAERMRPDDATREELQAWNDRWRTELCPGLKLASEPTPAPEPAAPEAAASPAAMPVVATEETTRPPEPLPTPEGNPAPAARLPPVADQEVSQTPDPIAPPLTEAVVSLPYPYNQMNPGDVPAEVWKRAREARS